MGVKALGAVVEDATLVPAVVALAQRGCDAASEGGSAHVDRNKTPRRHLLSCNACEEKVGNPPGEQDPVYVGAPETTLPRLVDDDLARPWG